MQNNGFGTCPADCASPALPMEATSGQHWGIVISFVKVAQVLKSITIYAHALSGSPSVGIRLYSAQQGNLQPPSNSSWWLANNIDPPTLLASHTFTDALPPSCSTTVDATSLTLATTGTPLADVTLLPFERYVIMLYQPIPEGVPGGNTYAWHPAGGSCAGQRMNSTGGLTYWGTASHVPPGTW